MNSSPDPAHDTHDFVYIPVPKEHAITALALIARLVTGGAQSPTTPESPLTDSPSEDHIEGWSDSEIDALLRLPLKVCETLRDVYSALDNAKQPLSTSELATQTGRDYGQLKNLPTSLRRVINKRFAERPAPFASGWGPAMEPPRTAELYFWLTAERSAQLRRLNESTN